MAAISSTLAGAKPQFIDRSYRTAACWLIPMRRIDCDAALVPAANQSFAGTSSRNVSNQRDATISHQNDIWLLTRSSIAPKWKGRRWDRLVRAEILKAR